MGPCHFTIFIIYLFLEQQLLYVGPSFGTTSTSEIFSLPELDDVSCYIPPYPEDKIQYSVGFLLQGILYNCGEKTTATILAYPDTHSL